MPTAHVRESLSALLLPACLLQVQSVLHSLRARDGLEDVQPVLQLKALLRRDK